MFQIGDLTYEYFLVTSQFETDHFIADMVARITGFAFLLVYRSFHNAVHNQYVASEQGIGNFEVVFSFYAVHLEEAVHRLGFWSDYTCVRLKRRFLGFGNGVGFGLVYSFGLAFLFLLLFKNVGRL